MTEDTRLYRPSWADRGILCTHHESSEEETEALENGHEFHQAVAHFIEHKKVPTQLAWAAANQISSDIVESAQRAAESVLVAFDEVRGVEQPIHVYDVSEEEITYGTADVWGYKNGRLKLKDWKTGQDHGYRYQMAHYALGLMDQEHQSEIDIEESYVQSGKVKRYTLKYDEAAALVSEIYDRVLDRENQPYQLNDYCSWCKLKGSCPAWKKELSVATSPAEAPDILRERLEDIKADPAKLGRFIGAFRAFKTLYESMELEVTARELMDQGVAIEGLIQYDRKGRPSINSELFLEKVVPQLGRMRAAGCITVSVDKALETWETFTKEPFPVPVEPGPPLKVLKVDRKALENEHRRTIRDSDCPTGRDPSLHAEGDLENPKG